MTKVLIATEKPFAPDAVAAIKRVFDNAGFETILFENYTEQAQLIEAVKEVDGIIIRSDIVSKEVIDAANNLKIVVRAGAGYDNIDLAAATAKNVVAMNTPGQNANAVAELAFALMLAQIRNNFNGKAGTELKGKTLGLHGFGHIGKNMARIAKGFGMKVMAYDPYLHPTDFGDAEIATSIENLYSHCNFVSVNIPANDKTKKSLNFELLSTMPKNAVLVNTARKEVINEPDLIKLFTERTDFRYVADVAPDCTPDLKPFEGRFTFTSKKMGAQTAEANNNAGIAAANQIVKFIKEGDITFKVN